MHTVHACSVTCSESGCHCVFKTDISGMMVAFMWESLACPHYQPDTHVVSKKSPSNGTNSALMRRIRKVPFSKTLISGPQISCQSSAVDRHRIGEKAVPNKSATCQSNAQTRARSHRHRKVHTRGQTRAWTHTHTQTPVCDSISSFRLIGPNSVFSITSRWLLPGIRERIRSSGLSSALLININLQMILPHWIAISFYKGSLIFKKKPFKSQGNIS